MNKQLDNLRVVNAAINNDYNQLLSEFDLLQSASKEENKKLRQQCEDFLEKLSQLTLTNATILNENADLKIQNDELSTQLQELDARINEVTQQNVQQSEESERRLDRLQEEILRVQELGFSLSDKTISVESSDYGIQTVLGKGASSVVTKGKLNWGMNIAIKLFGREISDGIILVSLPSYFELTTLNSARDLNAENAATS